MFWLRRRPNVLGDDQRLIKRRRRRKTDKRLTPVARDDVALSHIHRENFSDISQHVVADRMAIIVIDVLEVVDIRHEFRVGG